VDNLFPVTNKPDEFDLFWSQYPRREGKLIAQKALKKALKSAKISDIMAGLARYVAKTSGTEKQFICMPATWLNAGRWMDESDSFKTVQPDEHDAKWRWRLKDYKPGAKWWSSSWGSRPEDGGSDIPRHLMAEWEKQK
jgi:hypothetical protein